MDIFQEEFLDFEFEGTEFNEKDTKAFSSDQSYSQERTNIEHVNPKPTSKLSGFVDERFDYKAYVRE